MSLASFRSLAVASIPAIVVLSLSPFAGASPLYNQAEFTPKATSDVLGTVSFGGSNLLSEIVTRSSASFEYSGSQSEFTTFGSSVERTTTDAAFELPSELALAPFSTFGGLQGGRGYGETTEFDPAPASFTTAFATAPEPEGVGIAVVALLLVVGAFSRRLRGSQAIRPL